MPSKKKKYNARFPAGRIKKIMQSDEEVGKVAQAVPIIISRTLELFVESLLQKTLRITKARNAKTLSPAHMRQCIMAENRFDFLRELVKNVPDINVEEAAAAAAGAGAPPAAADAIATGSSAVSAGLSAARPRLTDSDSSDDDDDDDVEFVSGSSTPNALPNAGPADLSRATAAVIAATAPSTSNGHKRNAYGQSVAAANQSSYAIGLPQQNQQSRLHQPPQQYAVDLAPASGASSAATTIRSFAANYYTEIDASILEGNTTSSSTTTATSQSAKSSPTAGGDQQGSAQSAAATAGSSQLHRSASTPSANFYMETQPTQQQRPINLSPVAVATAAPAAVEKLQPPIINFDFSRGLENSSIRITAPTYSSSTAGSSHNSSSATRLPVPTTIVNVAIDQLTMTPLVKIDYSQLMSDTAAAEASAAVASRSAADATTTTVAAPPPSAAASSVVSADAANLLLQKPRRGRPPKIRVPVVSTGAWPAAPASAPVTHTAFAPYTPSAAPRNSHRGAGSAAMAGATTSLQSAKTTAKYQKSANSSSAAAKKSRRASSGGQQQQQEAQQQSYHHQHSVSATTQALLSSSAAAANASCLDMDEDYDNI